MTTRTISIALVLVGALLMTSAPAYAADPSSGTLTKKGDVVWTGGPFAGSNPVLCAGPNDPSCDHFYLHVDSSIPAGEGILVAIDGEYESDDYDLFVYYPDGTLAGSKATASGDEAVVVEHRTDKGTGPYEIRVQPWLVNPGSTYTGLADRTNDEPVDQERECLEPYPDSLSMSGVTDDGSNVSLDVVVLLDGVKRDRADQILAKAVEAYAGVNTTLNVVDMRPVGFKGDNADDLIQQAKDLYGGERPPGSDLVYVLTSEDIQLPGLGTAVAGLADCIGGVRYPTRAFAVGEEFSELENTMVAGVFATRRFGGARIMAHELGHLMGAHHHYANCVEGVPSDFDVFAPSPCTLMFNSVSFGSINFSTLNNAVVRGHAVNYARP